MHTRRRIAELGRAVYLGLLFNEEHFPDFTPNEIMAVKKCVEKRFLIFTTTPQTTAKTPMKVGPREDDVSSWQQLAIRHLEES